MRPIGMEGPTQLAIALIAVEARMSPGTVERARREPARGPVGLRARAALQRAGYSVPHMSAEDLAAVAAPAIARRAGVDLRTLRRYLAGGHRGRGEAKARAEAALRAAGVTLTETA